MDPSMADPFPECFPLDFHNYLQAHHYSFHRLADPLVAAPDLGPWVFFCSTSDQHPTNCEIQHKIKYLFLNDVGGWFRSPLCQFWRAVEREGRCLLSTRNQPFRLLDIDDEVYKYRMACERYEFDVGEEEGLGIPGRVFRNRSIESTPNVRHYTIQEHPLRDFALCCEIKSSIAIPVFEPSSSTCVGVIELADYLDDYPSIYEKLKRVGLEAPKRHPVNQVVNQELKEALRVASNIPDVYMAQAWEPCIACGIVFNADTNMRVVLREKKRLIPDDFNYKLEELHEVSASLHLRKGQGVTGRALLYNKLSFCTDIKQFAITDWPLAHYACETTFQIGSLAICWQSSNSENNVHVLEYFFKNVGDSYDLLFLMLKEMKKHLPSFKLASGQTLGEELPILIVDSYKNERQYILQIPEEREAMQQPYIDAVINGRNEAIREEIETIPREQRVTRVSDGLASMIDDDHQEQHGILNSSSQQTETAKIVRRKYRKSGIPISLEEIRQQFGKKLEDAAESLGVSRSTLKRACREYGIPWWKSGKRNKDPCASYGASIQDAAQDQIPSSSMPPTCNPSHQSPVAIDASRTKNCVPLEGIDIKVIYGDKSAIKFKLSLSSRIVELQQQVVKRLNGVDFGNYSIQYQDEDNDWILIHCDDDLQDYLNSSISSRKFPVTIYLKRFNMSI